MENELLKAHPLFLGNMANSTVDDDDKHWVYGDGGPLAVLQASVAPQWQGAMGSEDDLSDNGEEATWIDAESAHLYAPGEVAYETDSDAAFFCGEYLTRRYDRDMLVLEDSEWSGRFFLLNSGEVGVVQVHCRINNLPEVIQQAIKMQPEQSGLFQMQDDSLRLMVASDVSSDSLYRYSEAPLAPGAKMWRFCRFEHGSVLLLSPQ